MLIVILAVIAAALISARAVIALRNRRHNRTCTPDACLGDDGLYHGQARAGLGEMRFGYYPVARSGCGAIAVCNTLRYLGRPLPLADVIAACEWGTLVLGATVGLNPLVIPPILACLLRRARRGDDRRPARITCHLTPPETIAAGSVLVLTHLNGKTMKQGAHTVALYADPEGGVRVANTFNGSTSPLRYDSPEAYLRARRMLYAIAVRLDA